MSINMMSFAVVIFLSNQVFGADQILYQQKSQNGKYITFSDVSVARNGQSYFIGVNTASRPDDICAHLNLTSFNASGKIAGNFIRVQPVTALAVSSDLSHQFTTTFQAEAVLSTFDCIEPVASFSKNFESIEPYAGGVKIHSPFAIYRGERRPFSTDMYFGDLGRLCQLFGYAESAGMNVNIGVVPGTVRFYPAPHSSSEHLNYHEVNAKAPYITTLMCTTAL